MDIKAVVSQFTAPDGSLAIPPEMSVPALCETLFRMEALTGGDQNRSVLRGWSWADSVDGTVEDLSRAQVNTRIKVVAARLQQVGSIGDSVAILAGNSPTYIYSFIGVMYAGMIPVPLYDPSEPGHEAHLDAVLADCQPKIVLTAGASTAAVRKRFAAIPAAQRPRIIAVDALPDSGANDWVSPETTPQGQQALAAIMESGSSPSQQTAFLQYTSGSTRTPAGVVLTHHSVIANALQIYRAVHFETPPRMVMWLPLHHDMGIILAVVFTVMGLPVDLMNPRDFLQQPSRWIGMISAKSPEENVYTAVPNFALELAARAGIPAGSSDADAIDLSRVAGVFIGSEPVTPHALGVFEKAFTPYGLRQGVLKPGYGLAEATLLVTVTQRDGGARIYYADRDALAEGRVDCEGAASDTAIDAADDAQRDTLVPLISCGSVVQPQHLIIVDPDTGDELPDGRVGEMWVYGANKAAGYFGESRDSASTFANTLHSTLEEGSRAKGVPADAQWLATGDLGAFIDGEIVITGRRKDLIVIAGRNHYPQDIEYTVDHATAHVAPGVVAAFAVPGRDSEQLVILAERDPNAKAADDVVAAATIRSAVSAAHGVTPSDVLIMEPGSVLRSSSGKIARQVNRKHYLEGPIA